MSLSVALTVLVALWAGTSSPPPSADSGADATGADAGTPSSAASSAASMDLLGDLPPAPNDSLSLLYSKRLDFRNGNPVIPIRITDGVKEVRFSPRGRMRMTLRGLVEKTIDAAPGSIWVARILQSTPAELKTSVQLAEFAYADRTGLQREEKKWSARGIKTSTRMLGGVFGLGGNVVDNRRWLLLLSDTPVETIAERRRELLEKHGAPTLLFEELVTRPSGVIEILDDQGSSVALTENGFAGELIEGEGFDVDQVEYGMGYAEHGFERRTYRGALEITADRQGKLAVVNVVPLESLLQGLVPSEIFARAHAEALKAQAVTARGEVLAKVGTKHLADPYLLCAEQHCAVYKGLGAEAASTNAAVEATAGEALFSPSGRLVDSVYSAVCGGHTENNDVVWGGIPNMTLRGKPDLLTPNPRALAPWKDKTTQGLKRYLAATLPTACRLSSFAQPTKYRWERRFTADEVDALAQKLNIGKVHGMTVAERGVSGRASVLTLSGDEGSSQLRGELVIRKFFKMLNSAMFVVEAERTPAGGIKAWVFRGGGWGHGVGMCQTGAIGRAEAGHSYKAILRHYYNGARVSRIY